MKKTIGKTLLLLLTGTVLFAFHPKPGGEGFEVFVNGKVVLQRFGQEMNKPHVLRFASGSANDEITVKYHHCGRSGKNRVLTVTDEKDQVLKELRFADEGSNAPGMTCRVSDIISLTKGPNRTLKLFYRSSELPNGRLLVSIVSGNPTATGHP